MKISIEASQTVTYKQTIEVSDEEGQAILDKHESGRDISDDITPYLDFSDNFEAGVIEIEDIFEGDFEESDDELGDEL